MESFVFSRANRNPEALKLAGSSNMQPDDGLGWLARRIGTDVREASYAWAELREEMGFDDEDPLFQATREQDFLL